MYTELISDSYAIHVHSEMQQLLLHNKGIHRVVLITDSTNFDGENPENLRHICDLNFDEHGGLAGSKMTMELACRNIMTHTNCGIAQAFLMGALNPARALSLDDELGSIEVGKLANLVMVDDKFHVYGVFLEGEQKY